jgi:hypothetical protein
VMILAARVSYSYSSALLPPISFFGRFDCTGII